MSNSKLSPVDSVRDNVTDKMLSVAFQDLKVCTGFFGFNDLLFRVREFLGKCYGIDMSSSVDIKTEEGSITPILSKDVNPNDLI